MVTERLKKQLDFIIEIDKLKHIFRQTLLMDGSRRENDAEHSWHLAVMAILLKDYATEDINLEKVIKMVLVHDLVEIDAGDTFCYDQEANLDKADRENKAADRLFAILPEDQRREIRDLWEEFEDKRTPEAQFAASLDRFQPLLHNYNTSGHTWRKGNVTSDMVIERNMPISGGAPELWEYVKILIEDSIEKGYLKR